MRRRLLLGMLFAAALTWSASASAAAGFELTPVGRLPFPERGYVVDLPTGIAAGPGTVVVRENGRPVTSLQVSPLGHVRIAYGVVLALDTSDSMTGGPLAAALAATHAFLQHRQPDQRDGIVAFNSSLDVLQQPTASGPRLEAALARPLSTAYGTRIYDALDRSLALLRGARLSTGAIVLLSDGADIGSRSSIEQVLASARARHIRIFTIGLRSGAFDSAALRRLAAGTGGTYAEASSPGQLQAVYGALGQRLAGEYVIQYRSELAPQTHVRVSVAVDGVGTAAATYVAPKPSGLAPFHRSLASRILLSRGGEALLVLLVAALAAFAVASVTRPRGRAVVDRMRDFTAGAPAAPRGKAVRRVLGVRPQTQHRRLAKLEEELEIARIDLTAGQVVLATVVVTLLVVVLLAVVAPVLAILGLLAPLAPRTLIRRKLRSVRDEFAEQLAPNLQVLASSLRVGHSFIGALTLVVENANEPSQSELRRVLVDEQLRVPVDEAIRAVAVRMENRDLEQVAVLAELQRTAGGNAAEVLDTVVETLRGRADLRRLLKTLTAQGRMARWILSGLPVVVGLGLWLLQPTVMRPLFVTGIGQVLLVVAVLLVMSGSLIIQKIVDIKV